MFFGRDKYREHPGRTAISTRLLCLSAWCVLFLLSAAAEAEMAASQNLVAQEMSALDKAFKTTVDALVLNEPERIVTAFDEVGRIRKQIEGVEKKGEPILLPRNQKRFREFSRLDDKFHKEVNALVTAAAKKKMSAVRGLTHRLLDACIRCHAIFR